MLNKQPTHDKDLPNTFCWSKMGVEAGQTLETILQRKEIERLANGGIFAWGVGSSLGKSLGLLKKTTNNPTVIFTTMKSKAKSIDVAPKSIFLWLTYFDHEGVEKPLPQYSLVTSRGETELNGKKKSHYALICKNRDSLLSNKKRTLDSSQLVNLISGKKIGYSQVTSIVEINKKIPAQSKNYDIGFSAHLEQEGQVKLARHIQIKESDLTQALIASSKNDVQAWKLAITNLRNTNNSITQETLETSNSIPLAPISNKVAKKISTQNINGLVTSL